MSQVFDDYTSEDMLETFGVDCIYFQARETSQLQFGIQKLDSDAILGFHYEPGIGARLIRTSVNYQIVNSEEGRIYKGGARFTIPKKKYINGKFIEQSIYHRIFIGDVIVVRDKPIRDFDVLTKGKRDKVYAFDISTILSLSYSDATKKQIKYIYGTDYKITVDDKDVQAVLNEDGTVSIIDSSIFDFCTNLTIPVISNIQIVWLENGNHPPEGEHYVIELLTSPNYIVYDDLAKPRATHDSDEPKMVMCVKRAFVNMNDNPIDKALIRQPVLNEEDIALDLNL